MDSYMGFAEKTGPDNSVQNTVIAIDASPSMLFPDLSPFRLDAARIAVRKLLGRKATDYPNDNVGIVAFSVDARIVCPLTAIKSGHDHICHALQQINVRDFTNIGAGLEVSGQVLAGRTRGVLGGFVRSVSEWAFDARSAGPAVDASSTTSHIILLTDGSHNAGRHPEPIAQSLKAAGVCIDVIGVAGDHCSEELDEELMKRVASPGADGQPRYCFITDTDALVAKFETLSRHLRPI